MCDRDRASIYHAQRAMLARASRRRMEQAMAKRDSLERLRKQAHALQGELVRRNNNPGTEGAE